MNQDANGNKELLWKEVGKVNEVKVESCSTVKDGNERLRCEGFGKNILKVFIM